MYYLKKYSTDLISFYKKSIKELVEIHNKSEEYAFDENKIEEYYAKANDGKIISPKNILYHITKDYETLSIVSLLGFENIADYGCGCSNTGFLLASNMFNVDCFDFQSKSLEFQKWRKKEYNLKNLNYYTLNEFDKNEKKYDAIVCFEVLEHIKNPKETIDKLIKKININGALIVTASAEPFNINKSPEHICEMTNEKMYAYIISQGFKNSDTIVLSKEHTTTIKNYPFLFIKIKE